ncbi:MAG: DUF5131 family protein, partial [Thermodesulfobacteriota bacterium]
MLDRLNEGKWWDRGHLLIEGCTRVSPGCDHCWAAGFSHRFDGALTDETGNWTGEVRLRPEGIENLGRGRPGVRAIWNDLFHPRVPFDFVARVFFKIGHYTDNIYVILTKRPQRMVAFYQWFEAKGYPLKGYPLPRNIIPATSAENQEQADARLPFLLQVPGLVRMVSLEPLLGPVDLTPYLRSQPALGWVVCGGETG